MPAGQSVVVFDWMPATIVDNVWQLLQRSLKQTPARPTAVVLLNRLADADTGDNFVYTSAHDVDETFRSFTQSNQTHCHAHWATSDRVYFPVDIMQRHVDAQIMERARDYGIRFYDDHYKRTIIWHLARGQTVCFYST